VDHFDATALPGTEGGSAPFFSIDGRWIGFADGSNVLKRVAVAGGAAITLATQMVGDNAIVLRWTAPGDNGSIGTAAAYDLRMSTTAITTGTFGSATLLPSLPVPLPSGTVQTYIVTGLTPGRAYSFAIKARDGAVG
jgi:hypothetical protein